VRSDPIPDSTIGHESMTKMENFRQFLKTTSYWEVFFYKFYKLEVYL